MRRVVVTGAGLCSPLGNDLAAVSNALAAGSSGIVRMPEWEAVGQLGARLAGKVEGITPKQFGRRRLRTVGRVGMLAFYATDRALEASGLSAEVIAMPTTGLCYGSTHGSTSALEDFCRTLFESGGLAGIPGTSYLKIMSHTCAANLAQDYGIVGPVTPTVSACASASQAIGVGFDAIARGSQDVMVCGGAEELHFLHSGVFDIVYAASTGYNEAPERSPRPFDQDRDGLVVAEGAGTLVLEEYEHAKRRGAPVMAELLGWGNTCDGTHVTAPSAKGMASAMRAALQGARVPATDIDYVNAHGTATELGDIAESQATEQVLGCAVPISSTKGHTGHTLGACGAIEAAFCLVMMRDGFLPANRNLDMPDERCARLNYLRAAREASPRTVMSNNFAFGGINTSLVFRSV